MGHRLVGALLATAEGKLDHAVHDCPGPHGSGADHANQKDQDDAVQEPTGKTTAARLLILGKSCPEFLAGHNPVPVKLGDVPGTS